MAIIEYLKAENAFTYREFHLPLEKQGFVYLRGKNGSGKSTPWEILQHLYYGITSRGLKLNNIVCPIPRDDPEEETGYLGETVVRNDSGRWAGRWLIQQARGHRKFKTSVKVYRDVEGEWSLTWQDGACPKKLQDAQALAAEIIGLKKHEFEGCLYLSQGMTHALIEGKPAEKSAYLSYLFGLDRLDTVLATLKGRLEETEAKLYDIAGMEGQLGTLNQELGQLPTIDELVSKIEQEVAIKARCEKCLTEIRAERSRLFQVRHDFEAREALQAQISAIKTPDDVSLKSVEDKLAAMTRRNHALAGLVRDVERRLAVEQKLAALGAVEDPGNLDAQLATARDMEIEMSGRAAEAKKRLELERSLAEIGQVEDGDPSVIQKEIESALAEKLDVKAKLPLVQERQTLLDKLASIKSDLTVEDIQDQIAMVEKGIAVLQARKVDLDQQQRELKGLVLAVKGGSCPTCRRPMNPAEVKQHLDDVVAEIKDIETKLLSPTQRLTEFKSQLALARSKAEIQAKLTTLPEGNLDELRERSAVLVTKVNGLRDRHEKLLKVKNLTTQIEALAPGDPEALVRSQAEAKNEVVRLSSIQTKLRQKHDLETELAGLPRDDLQTVTTEQESLSGTIPRFTEIRDNLKKIAVLMERLDDIPEHPEHPTKPSQDMIDSLVQNEQQLQSQYDEAVSGAAILANQRSRAQALADQVKAIQDKMAEFDKLRHRQLVLDQACKAVPKLKRRKLHQIACAIRDVLPRYASTMFSHEPSTTFQVEDAEEGFDLLVRRVVRVSRGEGKAVPESFDVPVKGLSGGEKQRLSVALVFTLHGLLDPSKQPDILILDEVDYGLDDNGVASLMALIEEIKGNYGTVIMTSHRPQISGAVFDSIWEASKENHVSTIRPIVERTA